MCEVLLVNSRGAHETSHSSSLLCVSWRIFWLSIAPQGCNLAGGLSPSSGFTGGGRWEMTPSPVPYSRKTSRTAQAKGAVVHCSVSGSSPGNSRNRSVFCAACYTGRCIHTLPLNLTAASNNLQFLHILCRG